MCSPSGLSRTTSGAVLPSEPGATFGHNRTTGCWAVAAAQDASRTNAKHILDGEGIRIRKYHSIVATPKVLIALFSIFSYFPRLCIGAHSLYSLNPTLV